MKSVASEPFWCERFQKYLKIVPNEEADRVCRDVQIYWNNLDGLVWMMDFSPREYREGEYVRTKPSTYPGMQHAIEVHPDKPEYEPL